MYLSSNNIRTYRRRSGLNLNDIAYLANVASQSAISRYENGSRTPPIELLLIYHVLFDTSVEDFFERHKTHIIKNLPKMIIELRCKIVENSNASKREARILFLDQTYKRLIDQKNAY